MKFAVVILLALLSVPAKEALAQRQGIYGEVFWLGGNQMPAQTAVPGKLEDPQQGIVREILFYAPTSIRDVDQIATGLFTNIKTPLIATTHSAADGSFTVKLPPGEYSVFVKEATGLFANLFNKENKINPVVVKPRQYTWLTISIDYDTVN